MWDVFDDKGIGVQAKGSICESSSDMNELYEMLVRRKKINKE